MALPQQFIFWIGICGAKGVGKTSLIEKLTQKECLVCIYKREFEKLKEEKTNQNEDKEEEDEEQNTKKKTTENVKKETGWNVFSQEMDNIKSLKWLSRHKIVSQGIEWRGKGLPQDLEVFISEISPTFCPQCKTIFVQYLEPTEKPCYFDRKISPKLALRFVDTTEESLNDFDMISLFKQLPAFIFLYDLTQPCTIPPLIQFYKKLKENNSRGLENIILVGLKTDLTKFQEIKEEEINLIGIDESKNNNQNNNQNNNNQNNEEKDEIQELISIFESNQEFPLSQISSLDSLIEVLEKNTKYSYKISLRSLDTLKQTNQIFRNILFEFVPESLRPKEESDEKWCEYCCQIV